jgi:phosphoribosylaminoimidazole (AIR) synthetase
MVTLPIFNDKLKSITILKSICKEIMASCLHFGARAFGSETAPLAGQCIDGKLYIEPGTVHVAPNGIFLNEEGSFIQVEAVCMDNSGVYVTGYNVVRWVQCPKPDCRKWYDADRQSSKCPHGLKVKCQN